MSEKVLIGYATKCDLSNLVDRALADTVTHNGNVVDVRHLNQMGNISGYDGAILGSAIRMGQWLPEARDFAKRYQAVDDSLVVENQKWSIIELTNGTQNN